MLLEAIEIPTIKEMKESFSAHPDLWLAGVAAFVLICIAISIVQDTTTYKPDDDED